MPEKVVECPNPMQRARDYIRGPNNRGWTFGNWTTAMKYSDKKTGVSGTLAGNHTFTLRYDWDATNGFHVNAKIDSEAMLFKAPQVMKFSTEDAAYQRYVTLTQKIKDVGDAEAARWFMEGDE